jgi:hypothetical protein
VLRWEDYIRINISVIVREVVDWIRLAQNMKHWRTVVNTVTNIYVPKRRGIYSLSEQLVASHEG